MRRLNGSDALMLYLDGGLNARLAGYKRPRFVVQVDAIKRAADGKPDYPWARDIVLTEIERDRPHRNRAGELAGLSPAHTNTAAANSGWRVDANRRS
jgi:hypothetical protein